MVDCLLVDIYPKLIKNVDYAKFFVAKFYEKCEICDDGASGGKAPETFFGLKNVSGCMGFCQRGLVLFGSGIDHL